MWGYGPIAGYEIEPSEDDFDIVADLDTTMAGTTGVYELVVKSSSVDFNIISAVISICGKASLLSGVGDVSTANPATNDNKCQSFSWEVANADYDADYEADSDNPEYKERMCYLCPLATSTVS